MSMNNIELAKRAGFFHNFTLEAICHHPNFGSLTHQELYSVACETAISLAQSLNIPAPMPPWDSFRAAVGPLLSQDNLLGYLREQGSITDEEYFLADLLEKYASNTISFQVDSLGDFTSLLKDLSAFSDLVESSELGDVARIRLLAMASIAECSATYWRNAQLNPDNDWNPKLPSANRLDGASGGDRLGVYLMLVFLDSGMILLFCLAALLSIIYFNHPPTL